MLVTTEYSYIFSMTTIQIPETLCMMKLPYRTSRLSIICSRIYMYVAGHILRARGEDVSLVSALYDLWPIECIICKFKKCNSK